MGKIYFGKYKGREVDSIKDIDYLEWFVKNAKIDNGLKEEISERIDFLSHRKSYAKPASYGPLQQSQIMDNLEYEMWLQERMKMPGDNGRHWNTLFRLRAGRGDYGCQG